MNDPHDHATQPTAALLLAFAALIVAAPASAQQPQAEPPRDDAALQKEMEAVIQKCIRDKTASPHICRASAYATALAEGYPADRAARLTGYKREKE